MADIPNQDAQARMAEMKAKIEAMKAQKAAGGSPAPAPTAAAPATDQPAAVPAPAQAAPVAAASSDPDKDAKVAAMRAKIEAAKATQGGTATAAAAAAAAAAPAAAAPAAPKAAAAPAKAASAGGGAKPKQVKSESEVGTWYFGRRDFMQSIGWMSFFGFITIATLGTLRMMFPRVIYENPPIFKAGFPKDYVPGVVSEKYKDEQRVWIIRQADGAFIALISICTHLGCTPRWLQAENKFKCPCHGSGFRGNPLWGVNFEGPAPRPLERCAIHLAADGQIEIDKSKKFLWEKGQWEDPAATLKA